MYLLKKPGQYRSMKQAACVTRNVSANWDANVNCIISQNIFGGSMRLPSRKILDHPLYFFTTTNYDKSHQHLYLEENQCQPLLALF